MDNSVRSHPHATAPLKNKEPREQTLAIPVVSPCPLCEITHASLAPGFPWFPHNLWISPSLLVADTVIPIITSQSGRAFCKPWRVVCSLFWISHQSPISFSESLLFVFSVCGKVELVSWSTVGGQCWGLKGPRSSLRGPSCAWQYFWA